MIRGLFFLLSIQESPKSEPAKITVVPTKVSLSSPVLKMYHKPPRGVNYAENPSVFGKILRGETAVLTLYESCDLLAFQDKTPRAKLHALVISKRFIPTVASLTRDDLPLLDDMRAAALDLIEQHHPKALVESDYILCFHVPPFNSVNHLHLHVLAPASEMTFCHQFGKYQVGTRWCVDEAVVRDRLKAGKKAVPCW
jgi:diadenosine tetraphosphate (Ap4A) HIT family hydrolase